VPGFDLRAVVHVHVVAVKAPPDDVAQFGFGASAGAVEPLLPLLYERRVGIGRHSLRNTPFLLGSVLGAGAKLDTAFAVVISLHGDTADALAVSGALPVVPGEIAVVTMAHCSPNLLLRPLRAFGASHL